MAQWRERSPLTNVAWVRFRPGATRGLSLLLVHALRRGFFSGFAGFTPFTKTNTSNFYLTTVEEPHENQLRPG